MFFLERIQRYESRSKVVQSHYVSIHGPPDNVYQVTVLVADNEAESRQQALVFRY